MGGAAMKRRLFVAVCLSLAVYLVAPVEPRAGQQPVFKTGIDLVRLDALVTSDGRAVTGLDASDFTVTDNGVPQQLKAATTEGDVAVALVLDTSSSVKGSALEQLIGAAQTLVAMLKPGDTVSLATVSSRLSLEARSTRDPNVIRRALLDARSAGRTALWDGLLAGAAQVARPMQRSLVLAFTDGTDTSSWTTRAQLEESLKRFEGVVYAVQSVDSGHPGAPGIVEARRDLQAVVNQTGGDVFQAEAGAALSQQFAAVLEQFRSRYILSYEPTGVRRDDGWHKVTLTLKGKSGKVKTRPGYYASGAKSQ